MDSGEADHPGARHEGLPPGPMIALGAISAVAAFGAGVAGCRPTGHPVTDVVWAAALGAVVTGLGSRATPVALVTAAAVAAVAGGSPAISLIAVAAAAVGVLLARRVGWMTPAASWRATGSPAAAASDERSRPIVPPGGHALAGALSAGLTVQALVRLEVEGRSGLTAAVAAIGVAAVAVSGWRRLDRRTCRRVLGAAMALGVVAVVAAAGGGVAALVARSSMTDGVAASESGLDSVRRGEQAEAVRAMSSAADDMGAAHDALTSWWAVPGGHLPVVGPQLAVMEEVARTGRDAADLAAHGAAAIDEDGLRPIDGRIDPAAVADAAPVLGGLATTTRSLAHELEEVDEGPWLLPPVRSARRRALDGLRDASAAAETGARAAEVGPRLLGAGGRARYLLAFVTPSEARATGFLGSYGLLTVTDGEVELSEVGSNDDLNAGGDGAREITGPAEYLARYARFEPEDTWQNVTMTPDGPTAGRVMAELFPQSGGVEVDGVIRIDPTALSRLLRLTGDVEVEGLGRVVTPSNVVGFLQVDQYRSSASAEERQELLGAVAEAVFGALVTGRGPAPARLAGALGPAVRGGHLSVWLRDAEGRRLIERLGADGAVPEVADDSLGVVTQNAGGGKIDVFLQRTIRYSARLDATTGQVRATAEIGLRNDAPASGEPDYLIGNLVDLPRGTNRTWLSVYSPLNLERMVVDGREVEPREETELGRNVWSVFVDVPSRSSVGIVVELAGSVDLSDGLYRFDLLPQTMVNPDRVDVAVAVDGGEVRLDEAVAPPPGGATVDGYEARAGGGGEQGTWALGLHVRRVDDG